MTRLKQYSGALIALAFLLAFVAMVPAPLLYGTVRTKLPELQLFGLEGSWTKGRVAGISHSNRLLIQDLNYRLTPSSLVLGRLGYQLSGGGEIATLDGHVSKTWGALRLSDVTIDGQLKRLATLANLSFLPVDGRVVGAVETLVVKQQFIDSASARIELKGLAWTLTASPMLLGDFLADVSTKPDAITAVISSPSGPLEAKGAAKLYPDRRYEVDVLIKLKPGASEMLSNYVRSLGTPDSQGFTHFKQKGKL